MVAPSLLRDIHTTLEPLYDKTFQERTSQRRIVNEINAEIKTDELTANCIREILIRACAFAYPQEHSATALINRGDRIDSRKITISKSDYNSIEGRISSVFLDKLMDHSHVYLHYLHQGWNSVSRDAASFRGSADTDEILYMEKKEHHQLIYNEGIIIQFLTQKAGCRSLNLAQTYTDEYAPAWGLGSGGRTRLHVTRENLSRLFEFIQNEAEDLTVKVPLHIVRACQIEGAPPLQKFLRDKSREFLEKSRSFF
jgi:hypothetical protein